MKSRMVMAAAACTLVLACAAGAQGKKATGSPFAMDKGKLRIVLEGQPVGSEEFQIGPHEGGWSAQSKVTLQAPGGSTTTITGKLQLSADGHPLQYEWTIQGEKKGGGTVAFQGSNATAELRLEGTAPFTQTFAFDSPRVVILDNNVYHHFAILAGLYDWEKKGVQTFSVLIPQDLTPGTVTLESKGAQMTEAGKLDLLRFESSDLEVDLYFDNRKLKQIVVPTSKVNIVRE